MAYRTHAEVIRHGIKQGDMLTEEGLLAAIEKGKELAQYDGEVGIFFSGAKRNAHTATGLNVGIGREADIFKEIKYLSQSMAGVRTPSGIGYGPEFLQHIADHNPEFVAETGKDLQKFFNHVTYVMGNTDSLVVGVSHAPRVELWYAKIMGIPKERVGELVAQPLEGFTVQFDHTRSGWLDEVKIGYKGQDLETISKDAILQ